MGMDGDSINEPQNDKNVFQSSSVKAPLQCFITFCCMCHLQRSLEASGNTLAHAPIRARSLSVKITRGSIHSSNIALTLSSTHTKLSPRSLLTTACAIINDLLVGVIPTIWIKGILYMFVLYVASIIMTWGNARHKTLESR
ncbi:hypothetical protein HanPSC8_Chr01g0023271 [Helianthus annuus]|nr:hypothetical protein HanPSC8_Chr01g0023271 [Helianthus annuus]